MPDHVHGVVIITAPAAKPEDGVRTQHAAPLPTSSNAQPWSLPASGTNAIKPGSLGAIVRSYKSAVAKRINTLRGTAGIPVFHRNYNDHIIRNEREWEAIAAYIQNNPANWANDPDNPVKGKMPPHDNWRSAGL